MGKFPVHKLIQYRRFADPGIAENKDFDHIFVLGEQHRMSIEKVEPDRIAGELRWEIPESTKRSRDEAAMHVFHRAVPGLPTFSLRSQ
jgi:hypothetical protein